ncbi:hypothetical protein EYC84_010837 [Monilinia fructicola]|uniref:Uncharacterized protein n=1 Tax=Monilinia fructicola TaxID=38448 RepID=A0A5M9J959_MONFR|nr:hypothetical protein EYC84_010837 [Monilinia fructicola]
MTPTHLSSTEPCQYKHDHLLRWISVHLENITSHLPLVFFPNSFRDTGPKFRLASSGANFSLPKYPHISFHIFSFIYFNFVIWSK